MGRYFLLKGTLAGLLVGIIIAQFRRPLEYPTAGVVLFILKFTSIGAGIGLVAEIFPKIKIPGLQIFFDSRMIELARGIRGLKRLLDAQKVEALIRVLRYSGYIIYFVALFLPIFNNYPFFDPPLLGFQIILMSLQACFHIFDFIFWELAFDSFRSNFHSKLYFLSLVSIFHYKLFFLGLVSIFNLFTPLWINLIRRKKIWIAVYTLLTVSIVALGMQWNYFLHSKQIEYGFFCFLVSQITLSSSILIDLICEPVSEC